MPRTGPATVFVVQALTAMEGNSIGLARQASEPEPVRGMRCASHWRDQPSGASIRAIADKIPGETRQ
jgi:hypothetical protein